MRNVLSCRLFRCLICFILVGCVLINLSPVPAHATSIGVAVGATAVGLSAPIAIGVILVCLGITVGVTSGAFDDLVSQCTEAMTELGYVVNDTVQGWLCDGKSYVEQEFVESVRDYVWDSKTLTATYKYPNCLLASGTSFTLESGVTVTVNSDCFAWLYYYFNSGPSLVVVDALGGRPSLTRSDGAPFSFNSYAGYSCLVTTLAYVDALLSILPSFSGSVYAYQTVASFWNGKLDFTSDQVATTTADLTLGNVALDVIDFPKAYETWGNTALKVELPPSDGSGDEDPDDNQDKHVYPITFPSDYSQVGDLTQESAQEGTYTESAGSEDSGSSTDPSPGTDNSSWFQKIIKSIQELPSKFQSWISDCKTAIEELPSKFTEFFTHVVSEIQNLPQTFSQAFSEVVSAIQSVPEAIKKFFSGTGKVDKRFDADWQSLFPFCVPFDLIEFLGVLAAEPEAPVIKWRFYVPNVCDEEIVLNLSAFDSVAQIMRTLELLAFCIGLILLTRNIIRG